MLNIFDELREARCRSTCLEAVPLSIPHGRYLSMKNVSITGKSDARVAC